MRIRDSSIQRNGVWVPTATRLFLLAALLLLVNGCSRTETLYRNIDWVLERYAVKTLDANDDQLERWRPILDRVLLQHGERELLLAEAYLGLLLDASSGSNARAVDGACLVSGATLVYVRHAGLAADLAAPLLASIEPGQIEHLEGYFAQRRSRYRKRYLEGNEIRRYQARAERMRERIEGWTGELNTQQLQRVQEMSMSLPDVAGSWLIYRERQEQRLLQLLRQGASTGAVHDHLLQWWIPWTAEASDFSGKWQLAEAAFARWLDELAISLTQEQRERFRARVTALRTELAALHGGEPPAVHEIARELRCSRVSI